jgi:hypothetical protein
VLGLSSVQFWLSLRFKNFIGPVAIGIVGWFLVPIMMFQLKTDAVQYFPYAFGILPEQPNPKHSVLFYEMGSLISMLIFLTIGFAEFRRRRVHS